MFKTGVYGAGWTFDDEIEQIILREILDEVQLCTCGSASTYGVLLELLERAELNSLNPTNSPGFYGAMPEASSRWVEFGGHVLDGMGLIEHGTGVGWAWLTKPGVILLKFLRKFGTLDKEEWPRWAIGEPWPAPLYIPKEQVPKRVPRVHDGRVEFDLGTTEGYAVACFCGWRGSNRRYANQVVDDWMQHRAAALGEHGPPDSGDSDE